MTAEIIEFPRHDKSESDERYIYSLETPQYGTDLVFKNGFAEFVFRGT